MRSAVLSLAAALAWPLPATAQPALEDWRVERQEMTWAVSPTAEIALDNRWGDIAVRTHKSSEVYLLANWQRHRDDPRSLTVSAEQAGSKLTLGMGFTAIEADEIPEGWTGRRADVTLFVPESATTHFSTEAGALEVRGTRGTTTVATGRGDIKLRVFGSVTARTEHGSVLAQFRRTDWGHPASISSTTGPIRVEIPRGGSASITLETRGEITSDYSMEVERTEGSQLKRVRLQAGPAAASGGTLQIQSHSGPIAVVETLVSEEQ